MVIGEDARNLSESRAQTPLEPAQADIVDPFGSEDAVFATMAQQIVASMPAVVRALSG